MRIGDVLLSTGVVTDAQLEEALRAQVMWGGRLGTNLVELGYISIDELSRALGRQHDLPAALDSHFARADRELQRQLPAELAQMYETVPLVRAGKRIVIASTTKLDDRAIALIAGQLDINRGMIVQSVAAELRIRYHLESVYGIERGQRFMRTRGTTDQSQLFRLPELAAAMREPRGAAEPLQPARSLELPEAPPRVHDGSVERRTYLRTLADILASHPDAASVPVEVGRTAEPAKPLAFGSSPMLKIDLGVISESLPEALSEIELSSDRDELARRVIGTAARFVPESRAVLLMMVRGDAAISWTSFCRDGTELPPLAVPLDHPGLVAAVRARKTTRRGASGDLGPIDYLLLASLGVPYGELVVAPVAIAGHVIGTLVLATEARSSLAHLDAITGATSAGFARLMRAAASS